MQISNNTGNMFAAIKANNGNQTPNSITVEINKTSSSIEELEVYFEQKISGLKEADLDTHNVEELRDVIREAAENKNGDSPSLPLIVEYPGGGSILTHLHLSFGREIKGELINLNQKLQNIDSLNAANYDQLQKRSNISTDTASTGQPQHFQFIQDNSSIRELAKTMDPTNISPNEARALAAALALPNDLMEQIFSAQTDKDSTNDSGNLDTKGTDTLFIEKFNMIKSIDTLLISDNTQGLATDRLEDSLNFLKKLQIYREHPKISLNS
ncbi:MAG: hypothetical protein HRU05_16160 [Oceanospirillaceae bacterium]|nr:hypothetical protein [Oceanospirillaceae bacterium]